MIEEIVQYPWGEETICYDSFLYKVIDEDANLIIEEEWGRNQFLYSCLKEKFKRTYTNVIIKGLKTNIYNEYCFEYFTPVYDKEGNIIKDKNGKEIKHRILVYLQGFLNIEN